MLNFEHIVQVNDLSDAGLKVLSRAQLWQGLILRAQKPEKFIPGLECHAEKPEDNQFLRTIKAGGSSFHESVSLFPEDRICTKTLPEHQQIMAESIAAIEEPEPNSLFVRFTYQRELDSPNELVDVGEHLKSAYVQMDRDAIAMIRMLAENQLFDQSIN